MKEAIAKVIAEIKAVAPENAELSALVEAIVGLITKIMNVIMGNDDAADETVGE